MKNLAKLSVICSVGLAAGFPGRAAAQQPEAYFGQVRGDVGQLYAVIDGPASFVQLAKWDECPSGYYSLGRVFHSNGFWLCVPNGARGRYWVGNVLNDVGYYYEFPIGLQPSSAGFASWDTCRTGRLIGHSFHSNGFWVCKE
ncbi:hypothetical protein [Sorangium sp. So ce1078]|uniref:hypothetical protein n=1 Tax=Sorangium sp. So ce1078 TaxID=3133329 RepID=UPI003F618229